MELHEKIQELRKERGLTQEELAEALYVSRTAISKWELGRGYPSIDSLKAIAEFYSVSIDELLSSERLISIAERENKRNIAKITNLFLGMVDIMALLLIFLPLYPKTVDGNLYSINLIQYAERSQFVLIMYWVLFIMLVVMGVLRIIVLLAGVENCQGSISIVSMAVNVITVIFLMMAREPYAAVLAFFLLAIKATTIFLCNGTHSRAT